MARTAGPSHKQTISAPQELPHFGTLRCQWREPPRGLVHDLGPGEASFHALQHLTAPPERVAEGHVTVLLSGDQGAAAVLGAATLTSSTPG